MKKILLSLVVLLAVLVCGVLIKWTFVELFFAEPTIIQTSISPDGKYIAYVFESNGGATTGWSYHISILPADKKLGKGNGNVYISNMKPERIEWTDNNVLYVKDYRNIGTTKRKERLHDIIVEFYSLRVQM